MSYLLDEKTGIKKKLKIKISPVSLTPTYYNTFGSPYPLQQVEVALQPEELWSRDNPAA